MDDIIKFPQSHVASRGSSDDRNTEPPEERAAKLAAAKARVAAGNTPQCSDRPAIESYDDDDNLRHAEHFRFLHTRIDDCASMGLFAMAEMEKHDDGRNPQLTFAVYHLVEMVHDLKRATITPLTRARSSHEPPAPIGQEAHPRR
jgi:hypothetical protein